MSKNKKQITKVSYIIIQKLIVSIIIKALIILFFKYHFNNFI
jgi:hypothetical protein